MVLSDDIITAYRNENGQLHRLIGPAYTAQDPVTGVVYIESYWVNGRLHRKGGPALLLRDWRTGKITYQRNYVNGVER